MKMIVVTGAAGLIGSGIVRFLNDQGHFRLVLVDEIKRTQKWKNLIGKRFVALLPPHELFSYLEGRADQISAIIHMGACSDTMEGDVDFLLRNNFSYTVHLAEYALKFGIRFIYASSAATYGSGEKGFSDDHALLGQLEPLNPYGFSKYCFDLWAQQNGVLDLLVGLKYFNVFGPNEEHKGEMASMVYKMFPHVQKEGVVRLFKSTDPHIADGEQSRDFIYVKDAVRMTCAFLSHSVGGIFNIGSGEATSWNTLAKALFKALGKPPRIEYIPMPEALAKQYQNFTRAQMDKYKEKLNDSTPCHFSIEEAVDDDVNTYLLPGKRW